MRHAGWRGIVSANVTHGPDLSRSVGGAESASSDFVHREIVVLAVLVAIAVVAFVVTRRFAASNEALRRRDAATWYVSGQQALERRDLDTAVTALRRATARNPDAVTYRLALAQALTVAQQDDAARQLLLGLREVQPEDSETNLRLARLEGRRGDTAAAGRYYEAAVLGLWKGEQRLARRQVRTEFIQFLLSHGDRDRALSELLALEASLGEDEGSQFEVARMLLQAGDPTRALAHFERVLQASPGDQLALAGAGEASFERGDYARAQRYLHAVTPGTDRMKELRTLTDLVIAGDPLAPRLPAGERSRRLVDALSQYDRAAGWLSHTQSSASFERRSRPRPRGRADSEHHARRERQYHRRADRNRLRYRCTRRGSGRTGLRIAGSTRPRVAAHWPAPRGGSA